MRQLYLYHQRTAKGAIRPSGTFHPFAAIGIFNPIPGIIRAKFSATKGKDNFSRKIARAILSGRFAADGTSVSVLSNDSSVRKFLEINNQHRILRQTGVDWDRAERDWTGILKDIANERSQTVEA